MIARAKDIEAPTDAEHVIAGDGGPGSHGGVLIGDDEEVVRLVAVRADVEGRAQHPRRRSGSGRPGRRVRRRGGRERPPGDTDFRFVRAEQEQPDDGRERHLVVVDRCLGGRREGRPPHATEQRGVDVLTEEFGDAVGRVARSAEVGSQSVDDRVVGERMGGMDVAPSPR